VDRRKTNPWHNAHSKLAWWAEREGRVNRLLDHLLQCSHPRKTAHPKSLESLSLGEGTLTSAMTTYRRKLLMARHGVVRVHALAIGDSVSSAKHPNLRGVGADVVA
jgi:hypothetical protein